MKEYEITISGWGAEIVVGDVTKEEKNRINKFMEENDIDDYGEFYSDWDLVEEAEVEEWHENDNRFHLYGAQMNSSHITVNDGNEDIIDKPLLDLICFNENVNKFLTEEHLESKDSNMLCAISEDKGITFGNVIEIEDEFDESKLKITVTKVIIKDYLTYELMANIEYDGEEIYNEGLSTGGKSFEVVIM